MSEVIRDAVIRLRLEMQKGKLESGGFREAAAGYNEVGKASKETAKVQAEVVKGFKESEHAVGQFSFNSVRHLAHAGHGVMQLARGIALMSASGEEDTRKMLEQFAKIEAAVSMAKGVASLGKFAAAHGQVGIAVAGVAAVATAGALAWDRYAHAEERAAAAAKEHAKAERERMESLRSKADREGDQLAGAGARTREMAGLESRFGASDASRMSGLARELAETTRQLRGLDSRDVLEFKRAQGPIYQPGGDVEGLLRGGKSSEKQRALDIEEERQTILQRQLQIAKEQLDMQQQAAREQAQGAAEGMRDFGAFFGQSEAGRLGADAIRANAEKKAAEATAQLDKSNQVLYDAIRKSFENSEKLRKDLELGAASNGS